MIYEKNKRVIEFDIILNDFAFYVLSKNANFAS